MPTHFKRWSMTVADQMNQHKKIAGADGSKGNFGVSAYPGRTGKHPDVGMSHDALPDSARSPAFNKTMGAPDHGIGKGAQDHHARAGKA